MITKTAKKREQKLLDELQLKHSYLFQELRNKAERSTMFYTRNKETGKSTVSPGVCIKLLVPADSALGSMIIASRGEKK